MSSRFPFPVKDEIRIGDYRIILLDRDTIPESSKYKNRNVFCLDNEGNIVWQIEELETYPGFAKICPFTYIDFETNELRLTNWCSLSLIVDYRTGKIISSEFVK